MKNILLTAVCVTLLSGCTFFKEGDGQLIYHWEKYNTGIEKFSRDHSYCMRIAEPWATKYLPDFGTIFHNLFYTEERKIEARADWLSEKGIWASYVPYRGAEPVVVNYRREDEGVSPRQYRNCMLDKKYTYRKGNIPSITNINLYGKNL